MEFAALGEAHTGVIVMPQGTALGAGQYFALFRLFAIICHHRLMLQWMELPSVQTVSIKKEIALFLGFPLFQPQSFD